MEMGARISSPCRKSLNKLRGIWRKDMCSCLEGEITHSGLPAICHLAFLPFTDKIRRSPITDRKINYGNFDNVESFRSFAAINRTESGEFKNGSKRKNTD